MLDALSGSLGAFTLAAVTMLGSACAKDTVEVDTGDALGSSSETSATHGETTTNETEGTESTGVDTNDTTTTGPNSSGGFYAGPDIDFASPSECDPFMQDCPLGEKCVPYSSTGGNLDANKCVPVLGDGQPGDPCVYGGTVDATDDCGPESFCWDAMDVDGQLVGVCTPFCQGTADAPICEMGTACVIANEGSITLCIETCDPLLQACDEGLGCYWAVDNFFCIFTTQDIPNGEPCGYFNDCAIGMFCAAADVLFECNAAACCTEFCALDDPEACPDPNLECGAFMEEGMEIPGLENVGACVIPGA